MIRNKYNQIKYISPLNPKRKETRTDLPQSGSHSDCLELIKNHLKKIEIMSFTLSLARHYVHAYMQTLSDINVSVTQYVR